MSKYPKYSKNHHFQNRDFSSILCLVKCEQAHYGLIITAWIAHFALYRMMYKPSSSHISLKRYRSNTELGRKCTFFIRHCSCSASVSSKEHFENEIFWVSRFLYIVYRSKIQRRESEIRQVPGMVGAAMDRLLSKDGTIMVSDLVFKIPVWTHPHLTP